MTTPLPLLFYSWPHTLSCHSKPEAFLIGVLREKEGKDSSCQATLTRDSIHIVMRTTYCCIVVCMYFATTRAGQLRCPYFAICIIPRNRTAYSLYGTRWRLVLRCARTNSESLKCKQVAYTLVIQKPK